MVFLGLGLAWTRISSCVRQLCAALLMPGAAWAEVCDKEILWPVLDRPPYGLTDRIAIEMTSPAALIILCLVLAGLWRGRIWPVVAAAVGAAALIAFRWADWTDARLDVYRLAMQEGCRAHPVPFTLAMAMALLAMAWLERRIARRRNRA